MINMKYVGFALIGFSIVLIVVMGFVKAHIDQRNAMLCELIEENPNRNMSQCPAHEDSGSWLLTAAFGIGFLILGSGIYLAVSPHPLKRKNVYNFKQIDVSKLDESERKIYEILKRNQGSLYQTDLVKETDLSKVKVTRVLDRLETKKIVERKRRGMANIVVLQ